MQRIGIGLVMTLSLSVVASATTGCAEDADFDLAGSESAISEPPVEVPADDDAPPADVAPAVPLEPGAETAPDELPLSPPDGAPGEDQGGGGAGRPFGGGTGGWIGSPVAVRVGLSDAEGRYVGKVTAKERWQSLNLWGGEYGHTQLYWVSSADGKTYHIKDNANHWVRRGANGVTGEGNVSAVVNRSYPDGSRICARWWYSSGGQWHNRGSSCMWIDG